jgi:hypothetical protein
MHHSGGGGVHNRPQVHGVVPLLHGYVDLGYVRIPIRHQWAILPNKNFIVR